MIDPAGDLDTWLDALCGFAAPGANGADEEVRRGFAENWRDVAAGYRRGRFAPPVPAPDEPDHDEALADFCGGFLEVLDSSAAALGRVAESHSALRAAAALRRRVVARSKAAPERPAELPVGAALRALWSATSGVRVRAVAAEPLRAA
jgi:hypothetical protein